VNVERKSNSKCVPLLLSCWSRKKSIGIRHSGSRNFRPNQTCAWWRGLKDALNPEALSINWRSPKHWSTQSDRGY